jgi:hypothetical protein
MFGGWTGRGPPADFPRSVGQTQLALRLSCRWGSVKLRMESISLRGMRVSQPHGKFHSCL